MENNNAKLIEGLRAAADFFESKPEFPSMTTMYGTHTPQAIRLWCRDKPQLKEAARQLGSFTKKFNDSYFELRKEINEAVVIDVTIDRTQVCRRVITWDCPDDESLLKLVGQGSEQESVAE